MNVISVSLTGLLLCVTNSLLADQCAWVEPPIAAKAMKHLANKSDVVLWCELCEGDQPVKVAVKQVTTRAISGSSQQEILVNGQAVDLAYLFVPSGQKDQYHNLGHLTECGATGVSREIFYPPRPVSGQYNEWHGKFNHANGNTSVSIKKQSEHNSPHWLSIRFHIISNEWGDNRGELTGYLHMDKKEPTYVTPFSGCHLTFKLEGPLLRVAGNDQCGALSRSVSGDYRKQQ